MRFLNTALLLGLSFTFISSAAFAQLSSTNTGGLGFSDNVNLESDNQDSDTFYRLSTTNTYREQEHLLGLRLGFTDYFKVNENDNLNWRLSDRFSRKGADWSFYGALLGRVYTTDEPGYTEAAFNYIGVDFSAERSLELNAKTDLNFGPGIRSRFYTGDADRVDNHAYGYADLNHEMNDRLTLGANGELGLLLSSNSDYSRIVVDLSGNADYRLTDDMSWFNELGLSLSSFTSRSLSTQTVVGNKRGVFKTRSRLEHESYSGFFLFSEFTRKLTEDLDFKFSFSHSNQVSRSGYQDFAVSELFASLAWTL